MLKMDFILTNVEKRTFLNQLYLGLVEIHVHFAYIHINIAVTLKLSSVPPHI